MAGNVKLMTSAGGGVVLDTATTTATDVTVKVPVTGVNNGTLVCSDSSGNVGIAATPNNWSLLKAVQVSGGASLAAFGGNTYLGSNWYYDGTEKYIANGYATLYSMSSDGLHVWKTAASGTAGAAATMTERMRIDSSGNLLVGTTATPSGSTGGSGFITDTNSRKLLYLATTSSSDQGLAFFINSNNAVGSIRTSGSGTSYVTTSDYRLKENVAPMTGALDKVAQLNPVTYTWKVDGSDGQGFIAHELQAVVPDCVSGEKDAVDAEGNPVYQGIDTSFLVATLTKAIQELSAKNDALEARIAALEAK